MGLSNEQRNTIYDAVNRIENEVADTEVEESVVKATDAVLSSCGVPDRITECETHDWKHVETVLSSQYKHGLLKRSECRECGVEKEEVYTLQTRVVDGSEVRI